VKKLLIPFILIALAVLYDSPTFSEDQKSLTPAVVDNQRAFLQNLATLCGKSFSGRETYTKEGRASWAHRKFVMHVTLCDIDKAHIPFHLDEDKSRTWMFIIEEKGLRFRHDHRHEDGTPEDQTLYGGYADESGTPFMQQFPADDYTNQLLGDGVPRQWNVILAEDLSTLKYQLHYGGELVFEAEFDLTNPL
jgi:hypothetical protein